MQADTKYQYWCFICQAKFACQTRQSQCPRCRQTAIEEVTVQSLPHTFQVYIKKQQPINPIQTNTFQNINVLNFPFLEGNVPFVHRNVGNVSQFMASVNHIMAGTSRFLTRVFEDMNMNGQRYAAATKQQIEKLQRVSSGQVGQCAICQSHEQTEGVLLKCGHKFHKSCILPWFEKCNSCPLCRCRLT